MSVMQMLMKARPGGVAISNRSDSDLHTTASPTPATSDIQYLLQNNGVARIEKLRGIDTNISGEWLVSGSAGDYECRATLVSGSIDIGTLNTWQSLSTTRGWSVGVTTDTLGYVSQTCILTIEIRLASSGVVLDTATIELTAEAEMF